MKRLTAFPEKQSPDHRPSRSCPSRWKQLGLRLAGSLAALGALAAFSQILFAQTSQPSGMTNALAATPTATPAMSHDLGGVWMQYPSARVAELPLAPGINK